MKVPWQYTGETLALLKFEFGTWIPAVQKYRTSASIRSLTFVRTKYLVFSTQSLQVLSGQKKLPDFSLEKHHLAKVVSIQLEGVFLSSAKSKSSELSWINMHVFTCKHGTRKGTPAARKIERGKAKHRCVFSILHLSAVRICYLVLPGELSRHWQCLCQNWSTGCFDF